MCSEVSLSDGERSRKCLAHPSSVCRQRFVGVMVDVLEVKSPKEHNHEG